MGGSWVTMDIDKAFDTLEHEFSISVLKKFGLGQNFISWIEVILKNEELRVFIGAGQGETMSAYVLVFALEILFFSI